jgi:DNA-binding NarL/FixJ family response regulator
MHSENDSMPIRVILVEDDLVLQQALRHTFATTPDMQLVAVLSTRAQGLKILDDAPADVLLVDLGLPDGSGIDVIRAANARWPDCNIMVSTVFGDEMHVMHSLEAGASGYLLKDSSSASIASEVRSLHKGGSPISPLIARQVLMRFRKQDVPEPLVSASPNIARTRLSSREQQVLEYITKGFTSDEIAGLMDVSRHTVLTFVRRIYKKLEVNSKAEAIYEARNQGLLDA